MADLPGALLPETLAWSPAERIACLLHLAVAGIAEAPALREPVPEKAIGILAGAPLPWMAGMAEAGRRTQRLLEALCIRELLAPAGSDGMGGLSPGALYVASLASAWAFLAALPPAVFCH